MRIASCLVGLILSAALAGCATNPAAGNLQRYVATQKPRAEAGDIKWSEYFRGAYNLGLLANVPGDTLERLNNGIHSADLYESGAISKAEFDYQRRALGAADITAQQGRVRQARQASAAQFAAGYQLMQASQPHTLPQAQPTPPMVLMGFLQGESINGTLRYCRYSNGVVNTIGVASLCPLNTQ
jgi:hypothetical protein